jgi:hypothetical protein
MRASARKEDAGRRMRTAVKNILWLGLVLAGAFLTLCGIAFALRFGGLWNTRLFGWFGPWVNAGVFALLVSAVGVTALTGAWLLDQRWRSQSRSVE